MRICGPVLLAGVLASGCGPTAPPAPTAPPLAPAAPLTADERMESPQYTSWAKCPVGTAVTIDDVTDIAGAKSAGTSTHKLVALTDAAATVEVVSSGHLADYPTELKYSRWMVKPKGAAAKFAGAPVGTYESAEQAVTVRGKEYKCRHYKAKGQVEAGPTETETWLCDDVPGGLVKAVHRVPSVRRTVTSELIGVVTP